MNNLILYIITVLIWGTTWYAIKIQLAYAPVEISVLYRAVCAALVLWMGCKIKGISLRFSGRDHLFLFLLGICMFSLHHLFIYSATQYIVSGVVSVVFSGASFFSVLNNYLFFRIKPTLNVLIGIFISMAGLCLFFWQEVSRVDLQDTTLKGMGLAMIGSFIFSLSGSISKRNNHKGLPIIPTMTMGMIYGALMMILYTTFQSISPVFPASSLYWLSLLYLVLPGSIIAFLCYLQLIRNIGPELASYTTVLYPIVALFISGGLEGYQWSAQDIGGLSLVILGTLLVMKKSPSRRFHNGIK